MEKDSAPGGSKNPDEKPAESTKPAEAVVSPTVLTGQSQNLQPLSQFAVQSEAAIIDKPRRSSVRQRAASVQEKVQLSSKSDSEQRDGGPKRRESEKPSVKPSESALPEPQEVDKHRRSSVPQRAASVPEKVQLSSKSDSEQRDGGPKRRESEKPSVKPSESATTEPQEVDKPRRSSVRQRPASLPEKVQLSSKSDSEQRDGEPKRRESEKPSVKPSESATTEPQEVDKPRRSTLRQRAVSIAEKFRSSSKSDDEPKQKESREPSIKPSETAIPEPQEPQDKPRRSTLKQRAASIAEKFRSGSKSEEGDDQPKRKESQKPSEKVSQPEATEESAEPPPQASTERKESFPQKILSSVLKSFPKSRSPSLAEESPERRSSLRPIYESTQPRRESSAYNPFGSFERRVSISNPQADTNRRLSTTSDTVRRSISERPPSSVGFDKTRRLSASRRGRTKSVSVFDLTKQDIAICFFPEEPDWGDDDDDEQDEDDDYFEPLPARSRSDSIFPDPKTPYDWAQRERWQSRLVYLIALVSYSISFSNIYHFPALVYHYGGIPFLIPYTFFTIVLGYPLHFLESSLGQYSQSGPVRVWDAAPIARGVGWSMFFLCLMIAYYYNMYAAYSVIYFARCFNAILPWQDCDEPATSNYSCVPRMCVRSNSNHYTPAEHYFFQHVLQVQLTPEILGRGLGPMVWIQVVGFLFAWIIVYAAIIQSVRSIGKVVFVLVILPYFILLMLLTAGLMLEGSSKGIEYFFSNSNYRNLLDIQLWRIAAEEVFFELGICQGTPLAFGSYCHHRNPTHIDSAIICGVNYFTSILCAVVIFLILGALSMEIGAPVADVLRQGPGIVFIAYPEALSRVPGSHIWCFMFFLMLFSVAIGTQIAIMETVATVVYDEFDGSRPYRWMINLLICSCLFMLGMTLCTANGYFVVHLLDRMTGTMPRLPIAVCMVGTIVLIYGTSKYCEDVHFMIGYYPNAFIRICLMVTPFMLLALTIPSWLLKEPLKALGHYYSKDAINVAWFTIWFILIWILLGAIYWFAYCVSIGQLSNFWRSLNSWGPRNFDARVARTEFSSEGVSTFTKPWRQKSVRIEAGDVG